MELEEEVEVVEVSNNTQGRRWLLTINNPEQTDEELEKYISELEHFKYAMFQREKGHEKETEHIQLFVIFSIGKRFKTIKNYFPTAHIEQARGTNVQCRDYCSKSDTRVSGPYEIGQFAEERQRTDKQAFLEMVRAGLSEKEISSALPSLYLSHSKDIAGIYRKHLYEQFKNRWRQVEVTYIYGPSRSGKTSYVYKNYKPEEFYRVTLYNSSAFDDYKDEQIMVFDEFNSSFRITDMNHYLDGYYVPLPARYSNRFTMYTKVYIISNLPLSKQYVDEQEKKPEVYDAFIKRIGTVLRIDKQGVFVEKSPVQGIQQQMEIEEDVDDGGLPW